MPWEGSSRPDQSIMAGRSYPASDCMPTVMTVRSGSGRQRWVAWRPAQAQVAARCPAAPPIRTVIWPASRFPHRSEKVISHLPAVPGSSRPVSWTAPKAIPSRVKSRTERGTLALPSAGLSMLAGSFVRADPGYEAVAPDAGTRNVKSMGTRSLLPHPGAAANGDSGWPCARRPGHSAYSREVGSDAR